MEKGEGEPSKGEDSCRVPKEDAAKAEELKDKANQHFKGMYLPLKWVH